MQVTTAFLSLSFFLKKTHVKSTYILDKTFVGVLERRALTIFPFIIVRQMFNLSKISFTSKSTLLGSFCYVYNDYKNKKYFAREKVRVALSKGFSSTTISSVVSSLCFNFEEFAIRLFYTW